MEKKIIISSIQYRFNKMFSIEWKSLEQDSNSMNVYGICKMWKCVRTIWYETSTEVR